MVNYFSLDCIPQETERIYLKKIDCDEYFNSFHYYSLQEDIYSHLEFKPFKNKQDTKEYLNKLFERINSGKADYRFLILKSNNQLVGLFGFHSFDSYRQSVEFGYGVPPIMQRKGIFSEVAIHLIKYLHLNSEIHRIYAYTSVNNIASIKGLERIGFQREGLLKDYYLKNDNYFDAALYSYVKDYRKV